MKIPESILKATVGKELYEALEPYRLKSETEMPWTYQKANPANRPPNVDRSKHNDWFAFKDTTRESCARNVPQPYRVASGNYKEEWINFNENYPLSPGAQTRTSGDGFQVLAQRGGYGLVCYEAFIGGKWVPVFKKYTKAHVIFGVRYRHSWYIGLHQDNNKDDAMCYIEPFAMSFVKEI